MKKIIIILLLSALSLLSCPNNPNCDKKSCEKQSCPMQIKSCPNKGEGKMACPKKENCQVQNKSTCTCETEVRM